ncbi:MAG: tetratricopeptide repeat protein [Bacteroidia bacterium]|nr:tetratricopeptide repeat protein [Bacteroidia bacterium]
MRMRLFLCVMILAVLAASACKPSQSAGGNAVDARGPKRGAPKDDSVAIRKTMKQAKTEALFIDGCTERLIGNPQKAIMAFREVLELDPKNAAANYEMAGIYREQKQPDRALKYAMRADSLHPENDWYKLRHAQVLSELGQHEKAMKLMKQLAERHPDKAYWQYEYAAAQVRAGDTKAALNTYDRIEKLEGQSDTLAVRRIAAHRAAGNNAAIVAVLESQIASAPRNERAYVALAREHERQENAPAALRTYERRAAAFPQSAAAYLDLAEAQRKAGKNAEAWRNATTAFGIPAEPERKADLLRNWYPGGDSVKLGAEDLTKADSLCLLMRRYHPDFSGTWTASANVWKQRNKYTEARDACRKAIALDKSPWQPWKMLLELNEQLGDNTAQLKDSREATELFPQQPATWLYYGRQLMKQKKYSEAVDPLETGASYIFDNDAMELEFRLLIIECWRQTGDDKEVVTICKRLLKRFPDNASLVYELCWSYSRQRIELATSQERMATLAAANPSNAEYLSLLGFIDMQLAEYDKAQQHLQQALKLNPNDALAHERMGDLQLALGNKDEAVKYWKMAKAKGSTSPKLDQKISTRGAQPD